MTKRQHCKIQSFKTFHRGKYSKRLTVISKIFWIQSGT